MKRHNNRSYRCMATKKNGERCGYRIRKKIGEPDSDYCRLHTNFERLKEGSEVIFEQPSPTPGCAECDNDEGIACALCHSIWLNKVSPLEEEE